jgi:plastocyanin
LCQNAPFKLRIVMKMTLARPMTYAAGLAAAVVLTGCGAAEPDPAATRIPTQATSAEPSPTATPAGKRITITINGKDVTPAPETVAVEVGETLTLVVTSDHDDEIHAHGFEVEGELKAGKASTITLTGEQPGVYEVETHHPALRLLMVAVR